MHANLSLPNTRLLVRPWITCRPAPISLYGLLPPESSRKQLLRGLCAAREPEVQTLDGHSRLRGSFARRFIGYFPGLGHASPCVCGGSRPIARSVP